MNVCWIFFGNKQLFTIFLFAYIKQYESDVEEIKSLLGQASRANVKQTLNAQLEKWQAEIAKLQHQKELEASKAKTVNGTAAPVASQTGSYTKVM